MLSHVRLFVIPWTVAHQAPLSMGFRSPDACSPRSCVCCSSQLSAESVSQFCLWLKRKTSVKIHGILQARILEWIAMPFSRGQTEEKA